MNEDVFEMIDTLHARLEDVRASVEGLEFEIPQYVCKLDRVDDQLYLLQVEIDKLAPLDLTQVDGSAVTAESTVEGISSVTSDEGEKKTEVFTPEMKENLADAGRALGSVLRDGKAVVGELTDTMSELKGAFSFKK